MIDPAPSFTKTYRLASGEPVSGAAEVTWTPHLEFFDEDDWPIELVEESWERIKVRTFWHLPEFGCCEPCDDAGIERDSVAWLRDKDENWHEVCDEHDDGTGLRPEAP